MADISSDKERKKQKELEENGLYSKKTTNLYWMRHAVTCADILKMFELTGFLGIGDLRKKYTPESKLSRYGIMISDQVSQNSIKIGGKRYRLTDYLFQYDSELSDGPQKIILTSNLKRTIETAIFTFGYLKNVSIIPVPYIGDSATKPPTVKELQTYFDTFFDKILKDKDIKKKLLSFGGGNLKISYDNIDWSFLENAKKDPMTEISSDKFIHEILPQIFWEYKPDNIVIISHSDFITNITKCLGINNLEFVREEYYYYRFTNPEKKKIGDVELKKNEIIYEGKKKPLIKPYGVVKLCNDVIDKLKHRKLNFDQIRKYIMGMNDSQKENEYLYCFPEKKVREDITKKIDEYIKKNPVKVHGFIQTFLS